MQTDILASLNDMTIKTLPNNFVLPHSYSRGLLWGKIIHDRIQEVRERNCWCPCTCRSYRKPTTWAFTSDRISRLRMAKYLVLYIGCNPRETRGAAQAHNLWCLLSFRLVIRDNELQISVYLPYLPADWGRPSIIIFFTHNPLPCSAQ